MSQIFTWKLIPLFLLVGLFLHGSMLGLTDDEAYYWVLAQKPALGYAFHPPVVAWLIALAQALFGWLFGTHTAGLVRLPAAALAAGIMFLGLKWMIKAGAPLDRLINGAFALLSFAGLFAAAWMMVPDLPLLFGWMLIFVATWEICFEEPRTSWATSYLMLGVGTLVALLSKYSAVLAVFSAVVALFIWAPRSRRNKGLLTLLLGCLIAAAPIIIWNATHDWASILYQIRDRHTDRAISFKRYFRFWMIQAFLAGPVVLLYSVLIFKHSLGGNSRTQKYLILWTLPGVLVFCVQPLWTDFKPHWAFVVWLPIVLGLGLAWTQGKDLFLARTQTVYGLSIGLIGLLLCHVPLTQSFAKNVLNYDLDPKLDVTNDMYGWSELGKHITSVTTVLGTTENIPIISSRYQVAAQTAFALGNVWRVARLPRPHGEFDEWPDIGVSKTFGPEWPELLMPVLFITDNRYNSPPEFQGATCQKLSRFEKKRGPYLAKWFDIWRCAPTKSLDHSLKRS